MFPTLKVTNCSRHSIASKKKAWLFLDVTPAERTAARLRRSAVPFPRSRVAFSIDVRRIVRRSEERDLLDSYLEALDSNTSLQEPRGRPTKKKEKSRITSGRQRDGAATLLGFRRNK